MGLDDWDAGHADARSARSACSPRCATELGAQVERLLRAAAAGCRTAGPTRSTSAAPIGVPVAPFPRWLLCPLCRLLAPLESGLFELKADPFRPDRTRYVHANCPKARRGRRRRCRPASWSPASTATSTTSPGSSSSIGGATDCAGRAAAARARRLAARPPTSRSRCDDLRRAPPAWPRRSARRRAAALPRCRGRHPHLRDFDDERLRAADRTILLGASNAWFPVAADRAVDPGGGRPLGAAGRRALGTSSSEPPSPEMLALLRAIGQLRDLRRATTTTTSGRRSRRTARRGGDGGRRPGRPARRRSGASFADPRRAPQPRRLPAPRGRRRRRLTPTVLERVVLAERLREVQRADRLHPHRRRPATSTSGRACRTIARAARARPPRWVPAAEVRGEGIFLQLRRGSAVALAGSAAAPSRTSGRVRARRTARWRARRGLDARRAAGPGVRYVLLHSFAHALMRAARAGVRLRRGRASASGSTPLTPDDDGGPMAGVLLYTAAPDSEGTLGGLVSLGEPDAARAAPRRGAASARGSAPPTRCAPSTTRRTDGDRCTAPPATPACSRRRPPASAATATSTASLLVETLCDGGLAFFPDEE